MSSWTERARKALSQNGQYGTAKTDETTVSRLMAVSSVPTKAVCQKPDRLSSVLTVPAGPVLEKLDTEAAANDSAFTTKVQEDFRKDRLSGMPPARKAASMTRDASIVAATLPDTVCEEVQQIGTWTARARAEFQDRTQNSIAKTDETSDHKFSSVLAVVAESVFQREDLHSLVSEVPRHEVVKQHDATAPANSPTLTPAYRLAPVDIGTVRPPGLSPFLLAASLTLDHQVLEMDAKLAASRKS